MNMPIHLLHRILSQYHHRFKPALLHPQGIPCHCQRHYAVVVLSGGCAVGKSPRSSPFLFKIQQFILQNRVIQDPDLIPLKCQLQVLYDRPFAGVIGQERHNVQSLRPQMIHHALANPVHFHSQALQVPALIERFDAALEQGVIHAVEALLPYHVPAVRVHDAHDRKILRAGNIRSCAVAFGGVGGLGLEHGALLHIAKDHASRVDELRQVFLPEDDLGDILFGVVNFMRPQVGVVVAGEVVALPVFLSQRAFLIDLPEPVPAFGGGDEQRPAHPVREGGADDLCPGLFVHVGALIHDHQVQPLTAQGVGVVG